MSDLDQLMQEDAEQARVSDTDLAVIAALAEQQLSAERYVVRCEEALAVAKKSLELIQTVRLPELMQRAGMTEFKLRDGRKVSVKPEYFVNVSEDRRERAMDWLRAHGESGLIKNVVSVSFGKDRDSDAQALLANLADQGFMAEQKESIHAGTLKALIKRRIEGGAEVDMELFGVHPVNIARVTVPK